MRTKKALMNLLYSTLSQGIVFVSGFLIPALIIEHYGSSVNGMISSIKQFLLYLAVVETGISASSVVALYKPLAANDVDEINGILSATRYFYHKVGRIFLLLAGGLAILYPILVSDEISPALTLVMVLIMAGSGVSDFFLLGHHRVLMIAEQKQYVAANIQAVFTLLNILSAVGLIWLGAPIFVVQVVSVGLYSSRYFAYRAYFRRHYPHVDFHVAPRLQHLDNRWDVFIHNICGLTISNTPIILLTVFSDLKLVSVFAVYNLVINALYTIISIFHSALMAGFGNMFHTEGVQTTRPTFALFEKIYYPFICWLFGTAFFMLLPFVSNYAGRFSDINYIHPGAAALFAITAFLYSAKAAFAIIMQAAGHFERTKWAAMAEAVLHLLISGSLVRQWGIEGVLIGAIISSVLRLGEMMWYCNRKILEQGPWGSLLHLASNVLFASIGFILARLVPIKADVGWFFWFADAAIVALIMAAAILGGNAVFFHGIFKELQARFSKKPAAQP